MPTTPLGVTLKTKPTALRNALAKPVARFEPAAVCIDRGPFSFPHQARTGYGVECNNMY